jgi:cell division protein FtsW
MLNTLRKIDFWILLSVITLMLFSISFVYSASASIGEIRFGSSEKFFFKHSIFIFLGFISLYIGIKVDYHFLERHSDKLLFLSIVPLILVLIIGTKINGAYRWLYIGPINFQPSEIAKFALIIHLSKLLAQRQEIIKSFKLGLLPPIIWTAVVCGLIAMQPNMSSSIVIFGLAVIMLFIGNINGKQLLLIGTGIMGIFAVYAVSATYRIQRLLTFVGLATNEDLSSEASSFQIKQAILGFGNGGFWGLGPGQSKQAHRFLPESYGDYIFAIIGEEYGFIGVFLIIFVFALILYRGFRIAKNAPDNFGYFLATGITITFSIFAFVSAGVNCGIIPPTGIPMPFISYGGTAIVVYSYIIGVLLNISLQINKYKED